MGRAPKRASTASTSGAGEEGVAGCSSPLPQASVIIVNKTTVGVSEMEASRRMASAYTNRSATPGTKS